MWEADDVSRIGWYKERARLITSADKHLGKNWEDEFVVCLFCFPVLASARFMSTKAETVKPKKVPMSHASLVEVGYPKSWIKNDASNFLRLVFLSLSFSLGKDWDVSTIPSSYQPPKNYSISAPGRSYLEDQLVIGKNKPLKDRFVGPLPNSQTLYPSGKLT